MMGQYSPGNRRAFFASKDAINSVHKAKLCFALSLIVSVTFISMFVYGWVSFHAVSIPLGIVSILFIFFTIFIRIHFKEAKSREKLRNEWGFVIHNKRDFSEISLHFHLTQNNWRIGPILDNRTWNDLDMDAIYSRLDRTMTVPGEQYLYSLLRRPIFDVKELEERGQWIELFMHKKDLRENVQAICHKLGKDGGGTVAELLWGNLPEYTPVPILLYLFPFFFLASIFLIFIGYSWAWFGLLATFVCSMIVHYYVRRISGGYFDSICYLGRLINCASRISNHEFPGMQENIALMKSKAETVKRIAHKAIFVTGRSSDIVFDYFKIVFLVEAHAFNSILKAIEDKREALQFIYAQIGFIDSMLSIASFRKGVAGYCEPKFITYGPLLQFRDGIHPLLEDPVPNSLIINSGNVLITGSNMSGKTTFLKMIGVNAVLAQTIFTCFAAEYQTCMFHVITLIGRRDNIIEGKSYYLDEIQAVLRMLKREDDIWSRMYILDEVYRGTNAEERLAAAAEVLSYLGRQKGCAFASTHDLELTESVGASFANYHFKEEIGENGIEFNYALLAGPSTTRNAIKLLSQLGYPSEIVKAAEKRVRSLAVSKNRCSS